MSGTDDLRQQMSDLDDQFQLARRTVQADSISMSISEITNLYKEGVLVIRPEFQRLYRWTDDQKSRLVESILLGIPLPSIFIAQDPAGKWELVDGLQRISTLLELQGLLPGENGKKPPLKLKATTYLSDLEGKTWGDNEGDEYLTEAQKLDIRFSRLDLRIIKRSSDPKAKFDLFQRLNSYGSPLTAQEVRTAVLVGINPDVLPWLQGLASHPGFVNSVALADRLVEEQFDIDLILRFLMLFDYNRNSNSSRLSDFPSKLDAWAEEFAGGFPSMSTRYTSVFNETFDVIEEHGSPMLFKKWDQKKSRFVGGFSSSSFEAIALGLGFHVANGTPYRKDLNNVAKELWSTVIPERLGTTTGVSTGDRISRIIPLGRELLALNG